MAGRDRVADVLPTHNVVRDPIGFASVRVASAILAAFAALAVLVPGAVAAAGTPLNWVRWQHIPGVLDVVGPRTDGTLLVAAGGKLFRLDPVTGQRQSFAAGPGGYPGPGGEEPYIALAAGLPVATAGCSFTRDDLFVLQLKPAGGVLRIDGNGQAHSFAMVDGVASLNGIAFDTTGRFGNRLLVTGPSHGLTAVAAIDCRGQVTHITDAAPTVEGGISVAPAEFGAFGGDLVAADELSGNLYAIAPDGSGTLLARSGLPSGGDIGVEGVGFVPPGFASGGVAYFADRSTPGNPHPGTDSLLRLDSQSLSGAGVREGDLLAATEGGAATIDVRCGQTCQVTKLVPGDTAHGEGHLLVLAARPGHATRALPEASDLGRSSVVQTWLVRAAAAVIVLLGLSALTVVAVRLRRRHRGARRLIDDPPS
jgi:hypothetical protein